MVLTNLKLLICLLILSESTLAQAKCLRTVSELKANHVKARWQETTENDGKPLRISITDGANGLVYSAKKAGVFWLTGNVSVCLSGGATEITLKNTKATSNVPMLASVPIRLTQTPTIYRQTPTIYSMRQPWRRNAVRRRIDKGSGQFLTVLKSGGGLKSLRKLNSEEGWVNGKHIQRGSC